MQKLRLVDRLNRRSGGGTISASLATGDAWATDALVGFDNLTSVDFVGNTTYDLAIDNLVVDATPTPEPASLALLGAGLAGLASFIGANAPNEPRHLDNVRRSRKDRLFRLRGRKSSCR